MWIAILTVALSLTSLASGTAFALRGNGGDAIRKPDGRILNYDLLEASLKTITFSQVNEADDTLKARIRNRLARLNVSEAVVEGMSHKFNELEKVDVVFAWQILRVFEQLDWILVDPVTINIPDENTMVSKDNAESMVHVAERVETTVRVDEELWPNMDDTHKQGAIWHELILATMRPGENGAPQDSGPVRKVVGKFLGSPITPATAKLFEDEINGSFMLCPEDLKDYGPASLCHATKSIASVTQLEQSFKMYAGQLFYGKPLLRGMDIETEVYYEYPETKQSGVLELYPNIGILGRDKNRPPEFLFKQPVTKAEITDAWYKRIEQENIFPICQRVRAAYDEAVTKYPHLKFSDISFDRESFLYDAVQVLSVRSRNYSNGNGKIKEYFYLHFFNNDGKFKDEFNEMSIFIKIPRAEPYFMSKCSDYFRTRIFLFKDLISDGSELKD